MVRKARKAEKERFEWPFGARNYVIFGVALLVIIVGYISLAAGSITLAPFLLVLGYCILIPISIMIGGKKEKLPSEDAQVNS